MALREFVTKQSFQDLWALHTVHTYVLNNDHIWQLFEYVFLDGQVAVTLMKEVNRAEVVHKDIEFKGRVLPQVRLPTDLETSVYFDWWLWWVGKLAGNSWGSTKMLSVARFIAWYFSLYIKIEMCSKNDFNLSILWMSWDRTCLLLLLKFNFWYYFSLRNSLRRWSS